jgi:3-oxoadipate enol-lactonase
MVGEHDIPDFLQITELLWQQVPCARKYVASKVGHMANIEAPEQVTQVLLAFLNSELRLSTS